jgi:hypothetical protein
MNDNQTPRRPPLSWPAVSHAAVLTVAACAVLWLRTADGPVWLELLLAALLPLTAALGAVWLLRARAARRWNAALDAYAALEIARARRWAMRK